MPAQVIPPVYQKSRNRRVLLAAKDRSGKTMQVAGRRSEPAPVEKDRSGMRTSAPSRSSSCEQSGKCI